MVKARREETAALEGVVEGAVSEDEVPEREVPVLVPIEERLAPLAVVTGILAVLKKIG